MFPTMPELSTHSRDARARNHLTSKLYKDIQALTAFHCFISVYLQVSILLIGHKLLESI